MISAPYTPRSARAESCHECGEPAVTVLVADVPERETGYVDEHPLCAACLLKLNDAPREPEGEP